MAIGNQIVYRTKDGNKIDVREDLALYSFGANITTHICIEGKGVLVFDDSVQRIGDEAFKECESLTGINIPQGVAIGVYAIAKQTEINWY